MALVLLDDHLLRDWLAGPDAALKRAVARSDVVTTNLWYARLCKSAVGHGGGALLGSWFGKEREVLIAGLIALSHSFSVVPMTDLAWRILARQLVESNPLRTLSNDARLVESIADDPLHSGPSLAPDIARPFMVDPPHFARMRS